MRQLSLLLMFIVFSAQLYAKEISLEQAVPKTFTLVSHEQELPQAIVVYRSNGRDLVPLQALSAAVGLEVRVDASQASANGWIGGENSNFLLDIPAEEARRGFDRFDINPELPWARDSADLYLDAQFLQTILPLSLNFNHQARRLLVDSENPLPAVEALVAQQANSARLGLQQNFHSGGFDPIHPHKYQMASKPTVLAFGNAAIVGDDLFTQDFAFGFIASGDIAEQSYEFNYNKLANERSEYRVRFSRDLNDYSRDWNFDLGQYQVGDITYHGDNLLLGTGEGLGFQIGDGREHLFGVTTIEGNAPPAWEIHLYRNGILLDITRAQNSGRYYFNRVALLGGANVFEMHLYGNNGEHQIRRKTVINQPKIEKGEFRYSAMYLDNEHFLFNDRDREELNRLGSLRQAGVRLNYGLTEWWDVGVTFQQQTFSLPSYEETIPADPDDPDSEPTTKTRYPDRTENYVGVTNSFLLWNSQIELEAVRGDDATAWFAGISRPLGDNHYLRLHHRDNGDMETDLNRGLNDDIYQHSVAWLEGQTHRLGGWQYAFGGEYAGSHNKNNYTVWSNRLSSQFGPVSFSHTFRYDGSEGEDVLGRKKGELLLATNGFDWSISSKLNYQWGEGFRDMETRFRWRPYGAISNHTRLYYQKPDFERSSYGFAHEIAYHRDWVTFGIESGIDNHGDWQINGTATITYNYRDNRNHDLSAEFRPQLADINVRVYHDTNNNGRFDRTDQPLPGITIETTPSWPRQVSDDSGIVTLSQVSTTNTYRFSVNPRSVPPGMTLRNGEMELMPLAGERNQVDLALVTLSRISGQVTDEKGTSVGDLTLNITDLSQQRITATKTDSHGRFEFSALRPGHFYLIPEPEEMKDRKLTSDLPLYPLNISPSGEKRENWRIVIRNNQPHKPAPVTTSVAIATTTPVKHSALSGMDANDYVLQVAAHSSPFELAELKQKYPQYSLHQLAVKRRGKQMYLLLAGQYPNQRSAESAATLIDTSLSNGKPIPRRVQDLRRETTSATDGQVAPTEASLVARTAPSAETKPEANIKPATANKPNVRWQPKSDWLSQQPDDNQTWQIAAARSKESVEAIAKQHQLPQPWRINYANGWYQLLWGSFEDQQQAQLALSKLDNAPQQPWLRPFSAMKSL